MLLHPINLLFLKQEFQNCSSFLSTAGCMFLFPMLEIQMVQYAPGRISNISIIFAVIPQMAQEANFKGHINIFYFSKSTSKL